MTLSAKEFCPYNSKQYAKTCNHDGYRRKPFDMQNSSGMANPNMFAVRTLRRAFPSPSVGPVGQLTTSHGMTPRGSRQAGCVRCVNRRESHSGWGDILGQCTRVRTAVTWDR